MLVLLVLILTAAVPSTAAANSTVSLSGRALTITGSAGVDNISVNYRDYGTTLGIALTDQTGITGCTAESATTVICQTAKPAVGDLVTASVNLGAGDDRYSVYLDGIADTVDGGPGDDNIDGRVAGEVSSPVQATDIMNGGEGDDQLGAGTGAGTTCNGGPGDDNITCFYVTTGVVVNGGDGRDTVQGGDGPDQINGDAGDDPSLQGLKGNDVIHGGAGNDGSTGVSDLLAGGEGADEVFGDGGIDRMVENRNDDRKQFWSLDDVANDGADLNDSGGADEGDNIHSDVENITGGYDDDTITGSAQANVLHGGTLGNDVIAGLGGDDDIFTGITGDEDSADGGAGNDKVQGNGTLLGGPGNDKVFGQTGNDLIDGGTGQDEISASDGNDTVKAVDGERDQVGCGIGADIAEVDTADVVNADAGDLCESLTRIDTSPLPKTAPLVENTAIFPLSAPGPGLLSVVVTLAGKTAAKRPVLGRTVKNVTKAGKLKLKVKLKGKAYRKLRNKKKFAVILTTRFTEPGAAKPGPAKKRKVVLKRR